MILGQKTVDLRNIAYVIKFDDTRNSDLSNEIEGKPVLDILQSVFSFFTMYIKIQLVLL